VLVIRDVQLAEMRQKAAERFASDLLKHLLENYPQQCKAVGAAEDVRGFVRRGIARAMKHGIEYEGAITVFLELLIQFGENFERSPVREFARNILAHPVLPGDAKVNAIRDRHEEKMQGRILVPF
jgi:hypothetical protein